MPAATAPEVSEVLELLRGIGALLHASGEERALSSLRVSLGEAGGGAPAVASALHGARVKSDEAWAAAKVSAGDSWGARFDGARRRRTSRTPRASPPRPQPRTRRRSGTPFPKTSTRESPPL